MNRIGFLTIAVVYLAVSSVSSFAQTSNASVSGFAQDASQAVIPGVAITATNVQTGVVTRTITNETGTYTILSLLPGTYKLTAELPGFKVQTFNDAVSYTHLRAHET